MFLIHYTRLRVMLASCILCLSATVANSEPVQVVASFSILADMVREVGGQHVAVKSLVGPDMDAHIFDPTPADAKRIASANLVVVNGLGFEGWLDRLVKSSGYRGPIVIASKGIKTTLQIKQDQEHKSPDKAHSQKHAHTAVDPHAWQSLANAERYVVTIKTALIKERPEQTEYFEQRADHYISQIRALDLSAQTRIAAVAPDRRKVITSHDAFGYFATAYGVAFYPLQGLSTGSEPSAAEVVRIINQIKKNKVSALFAENISDPRILERIAKDSGVRIGGTLYADALSEPGTAADTYLKMYEHNVSTIVEGISVIPTQ